MLLRHAIKAIIGPDPCIIMYVGVRIGQFCRSYLYLCAAFAYVRVHINRTCTCIRRGGTLGGGGGGGGARARCAPPWIRYCIMPDPIIHHNVTSSCVQQWRGGLSVTGGANTQTAAPPPSPTHTHTNTHAAFLSEFLISLQGQMQDFGEEGVVST